MMRPLLKQFSLTLWILMYFNDVPTQGWLMPETKVKLSPTSVKRCTTENQTMICTVNDDDYDATDISFQLNNDPVEPQNVEITNNRTAILHITNITQETSTVLCCVNNCRNFTDQKSVIMEIYVKPEPVRDLSCLIYDFIRNVTCTWDYVVDYAAINDTIYPTVTFYVGFLHTHSVAEWTLDKLETQIEFTNSSDFVYFNQRDANLTIGLSVQSPCGITVNKTFDGESVVKVEPRPVQRFSSTTVNSSCILVEWEHNRPAQRKSFLITISSQWGQRQVYVNESDHSISNYMMCDLVPGTNYAFTIKVKPLMVPGKWSLQMGTSSRTHEDVPGSSPVVTDGSYSWVRDKCKDGFPLRHVYIYWKNIPPFHYHGDLMGIQYNLTWSDGSDPPRLHQDITASLMVLQLSCFTSYELTLQAKNRMGLSKHPSTLNIAAADQDVPRDLLVERLKDDSTVYLDWGYIEHPESNVTDTTVFYIEAADCSGITRGQANWTTFSSGTTSGNISLPEGKAPENYCFGRAVDTPQGNSGFEWSSCIYDKDATPTKYPDDLKVVNGTEDNSLVLTWSKWLCPIGQPYISQYEVIYCPFKLDLNCSVSGDSVTVSFSREQTAAKLLSLNADVEYELHIRAVTRLGDAGPWSEPVLGQPVDRSLKPEMIALISIGSGFGLVMTIAAIVFCIRYCKKKQTRRLAELKGIENPDITPGPDGFTTLAGTYEKSNDQFNNNEINSQPDLKHDDDEKKLKLDIYRRQSSTDSGFGGGLTTPPGTEGNSKSPLTTISEGYVKAIPPGPTFNYVEPHQIFPKDQIFTVNHVHLDTPYVHDTGGTATTTQVDSYVHVNDLSKDIEETPILNAVRDTVDTSTIGSNNIAFTDDHGNSGGALSDMAMGGLLSQITQMKLKSEVSTKPSVGKEVLDDVPVHEADIDNEMSTPSEDLQNIENAKKEKLLSNCLTAVPRPRSVDLSDCKEMKTTDNHNDSQSNTPDYVFQPSIHVQSTNECNATGYVSQPITHNQSDIQTDISGYVSQPITHNQSDIQTDISGYVSQPITHNQSDADTDISGYVSQPNVHNQSYIQTDISGYVSQPNVHNQSDIQTDISGYVSQPNVHNQSDAETDISGYVSQPNVHNQSDAETDISGYVSLPNVHNQSDAETDISGYVSQPNVHNQSDAETDISGYVSQPNVHNQSDAETDISGYVSQPNLHNQTDTQTNMSGYVSQPNLHNQSDTQTNMSGYVSQPNLHNQSDTQTNMSGYVSHPNLHNQTDTQTNISGYVSQPNLHNQSGTQTDMSHVSQPNLHNQSDTQTNMSGYVSHPNLHNQSYTQTNISGYVSQPNLHNQSDTQTDMSHVSQPNLHNQSDTQTNMSGYVSHPNLHNQSDTQTNISGYVSQPNLHNQSDTQTNMSGYVSQSGLLKEPQPENLLSGYVPHPVIHNSDVGTPTQLSDYEPYPPSHNDSKDQNSQPSSGANITQTVHQDSSGNQSKSHINEDGYVAHSALLNTLEENVYVSDNVPLESSRDLQTKSSTDYIPHTAMQFKTGSEESAPSKSLNVHQLNFHSIPSQLSSSSLLSSSLPSSSSESTSIPTMSSNNISYIPESVSPSGNSPICPPDNISPLNLSVEDSNLCNTNFNSNDAPYVSVDFLNSSPQAHNNSSTDDKEDSGLSSLESSGENDFKPGFKPLPLRE